MLKRETAERIADLQRTSLFDVVRSLGGEPVSLEAGCGDRAGPDALVVLVEFGNEQVQGVFGLLAEPRFFFRLGPGIRLDSQPCLLDWACEFANQAVGCFRNRVRAFGPLLAAKPPQLATRGDPRLSAAPHGIRISIGVGVEDMVLDTWIELASPFTLPMSDSPDEELVAGMPNPGEVRLF